MFKKIFIGLTSFLLEPEQLLLSFWFVVLVNFVSLCQNAKLMLHLISWAASTNRFSAKSMICYENITHRAVLKIIFGFMTYFYLHEKLPVWLEVHASV